MEGEIFIIEYIVLGVVLIILILIFSAFRPAPTQKITENLYVVRSAIANFCAYKTVNGVILFDTGVNTVLAKRGLNKLGVSTDMVTHIFLTHTDFDHTAAISAFPNAAVYISDKEVQMINGETARRGFMHNSRLATYRTVTDNETLNVDNAMIQAYIKPGHTPGSTVYLVDNCYLVTGDLLRVSRKGKTTPFLRLMNMKHKQNVKSVEDSRSIINSAEYILTGHTGFYKNK